MYQQSENNLLNSNMSSTCPDNMVNFGILTDGWDLLAILGHPCKFQRGSRLGSITARHSCSGRQPNFAALNRGRHLYSAGRPSRWALAHISSCCCYVHTAIWDTRWTSTWKTTTPSSTSTTVLIAGASRPSLGYVRLTASLTESQWILCSLLLCFCF